MNVNLTRVHEAAGQISATVEDVFASLIEIRDLVISRYRASQAEGLPLTCADLETLRPALFESLRCRDHLVIGTGVVTTPNVLADRPRWLEWWQIFPGGDIRFLNVDLDPESVDFYDYTAADWFDTPRRTKERTIVGPYVDYGGTDNYILTLTVPIYSAKTFLGVAGADVPAGRFEELALSILRLTGTESALVNAEGRIIASNTPRRLCGSLLDPDLTELMASNTSIAPHGTVLQHCAGLPWLLLISPP